MIDPAQMAEELGRCGGVAMPLRAPWVRFPAMAAIHIPGAEALTQGQMRVAGAPLQSENDEHAPLPVHRSQIVLEIDRLATEPQSLAAFDVRTENGGTLHKLTSPLRKKVRAAKVRLYRIDQLADTPSGHCSPVKSIKRQQPHFSPQFYGCIGGALGLHSRDIHRHL